MHNGNYRYQDVRLVIFKLILMIYQWNTLCEVALEWMFLDLNDVNIGSGTALDTDSHHPSLIPSQAHIYTSSLPPPRCALPSITYLYIHLISLPSTHVKGIARTIICTNWHPRLLSHYRWYPTNQYLLHLTPVCVTILSTSCRTNHLGIVYIISGQNWHLCYWTLHSSSLTGR